MTNPVDIKLGDRPKDAKLFAITADIVSRLLRGRVPFLTIGSIAVFAYVGLAYRRPGDFDIVVRNEEFGLLRKLFEPDYPLVERLGFWQSSNSIFKIHIVIDGLKLLDLQRERIVGGFDLRRWVETGSKETFQYLPEFDVLEIPVPPPEALLVLTLLAPLGANSLLDVAHLVTSRQIDVDLLRILIKQDAIAAALFQARLAQSISACCVPHSVLFLSAHQTLSAISATLFAATDKLL